MGCWLNLHCTCVIIMTLLITGVLSDSVCKSEQWKYDKEGTRCLKVLKYPLIYEDAIKTCDIRRRGGRLITPTTYDDMEKLVNVFGPKMRTLTFWGDLVFEMREGEITMFDFNGAQLDIKSCDQCPPLAEQVNQKYDINKPQTCTLIYSNQSIHWNVTDCADKHYVICQFSVEPEGLTSGDIGAIVVGTAIFLCFVVTLVIDICLHLRKEKRKYFANNITDKTENDMKTISTRVDFKAVNFGSKLQLIEPKLSLTDV